MEAKPLPSNSGLHEGGGGWYEIWLKIHVPISLHTFVFALLDAVLLRRTVCSLQMRNVLKTSEY